MSVQDDYQNTVARMEPDIAFIVAAGFYASAAECLKRTGPKRRGLPMGGYEVECIPVNMKASTTPTTKPTQVSNEMAVLVVARLLAQLGNHDEEDSFGNARRNAIPNAIELLGLQPSDVKGGDTMTLQPTA